MESSAHTDQGRLLPPGCLCRNPRDRWLLCESTPEKLLRSWCFSALLLFDILTYLRILSDPSYKAHSSPAVGTRIMLLFTFRKNCLFLPLENLLFSIHFKRHVFAYPSCEIHVNALCSHFPCQLCLKHSVCARTAIYPQRCRVSSKPRMISYHSDFKGVFNRRDKNDRNIERDKAERKGENGGAGSEQAGDVSIT